ncbi:MAG TPA: ferritin-like domain-containing protein [Rhizomicrobium sp.]|nr:ferritin-like domain-containing protein [Rhizomicrobium sp.]
MGDGTVFSAGWTLDDVDWSKFDASKIDPALLATIKGASLVEYNAPDYVDYLTRVFKDAGDETLADIKRWGQEEVQHGLALGRWAEMADPSFNFKSAFTRFRAGYRPPHFADDSELSVRGSRRGEMIARCVVESGTSSFYSAIRDASEEPVLKEVAGRIAADEFRHYRLFFETLHKQDEPELSLWRRLTVAVTRVNEADDDELSYAYYCANVPEAEESSTPYDRAQFARAYHAKVMTLYTRPHINKLVQMVAKAIGAKPQGRMTSAASVVMWQVLKMRAGYTKLAA